jgi:hypothetical protein
MLVKVRHGVYTFAAPWRALAPWERYLARVHAVALVHPDVIFSHESAAALLGLPVFGDPGIVHVIVAPSGSSRAVAGVRTHRSALGTEIVENGGLSMTSAVNTAVDLARHRHHAIGLSVADAVLRIDSSVTRQLLSAANEGRANARGRNIARWPLERATALAETPLESVSRAVIEWLGFPAPELQSIQRSADGVEDRRDFVWRAVGLAGEADGDLKYDGRFGDPLNLLRAQRERDARLRRETPRIAHWGWSEATRVEPLRDQLLGLGLRAEWPEHGIYLHTLRRAVAPYPPHRAAPDGVAPSQRR